MLGSYNVCPDIAVKDLAAAKSYYEGTLGLKLLHSDDNEMMFQSADSKVHVYKSQYAGTNEATTATWSVDDVAGVVAELKGKGVMFEHYDMPGAKMEGDVHVMGDTHAA